MKKLITKVFGDKHGRTIKKLRPLVSRINDLEPKYKGLSDEELAGMTAKFKGQIEQGASLDDILPDAYATVREASWRVQSMRHFDVQLIGGIMLHRGQICEMKTGEGKTLVATLPTYLNALEGKGVHVVTVNDYLARRDAEVMGQVYQFLGLSVGLVQAGMSPEERRKAYACDVKYVTNQELGFTS